VTPDSSEVDNDGQNILTEVYGWLKNPNLLENLVHDLGVSGVIGEPGNLVTVLLVYGSRLCSEPLNLSPSGDSGVGKSFLTCQPSDFWKHDTLVAGYLSRTSLIHDTDWATEQGTNSYLLDLTGKIIVILEADASREFLDLMKPIRSHDKREIAFNVAEREGKLKTKKVIVKGWPVFITVSVNPSEKPEDSTRDLNLTPAYSEVKGKAVNLDKARKSETPWKYPSQNKLMELKDNWAAALTLLKPMKVVNPFGAILAGTFDTRNARSMRDFQKMMSLFESCVLFHQLQRIVVTTKNEETYVFGTLDDLRITLKIAYILLKPTITGLRADVLNAHEEFFKLVCPPDQGKTVKELMEEWHRRRKTTIKRSTLLESYLYPLRDAGLMNQDETEKAHKWDVSCVDVSETVETDSDTFLKGFDLEAGLRQNIEEMWRTVGVSAVMRGDNPISIASMESLVQDILSSVQSSTVRQMFIDKLSDPLASCLKNEEKITVGLPPTHSDTSDTSDRSLFPDLGQRFGDKVTKAREMWAGNRSIEEIELTVGSEVLDHCYCRGYIPKIGGRAQ
jgi:hypothetical protein